MTLDAGLRARLIFLIRVVKKEQGHLAFSRQKLFDQPFNLARAQQLESDQDLAEVLEAYTSRFCRLQDTVGDKLLPAWLSSVKDKPGTAMDNLDKAEKLGLLTSSDAWFDLRSIRNQMVHEYIEDNERLVQAVQASRDGIALIDGLADKLVTDLAQRFGL